MPARSRCMRTADPGVRFSHPLSRHYGDLREAQRRQLDDRQRVPPKRRRPRQVQALHLQSFRESQKQNGHGTPPRSRLRVQMAHETPYARRSRGQDIEPPRLLRRSRHRQRSLPPLRYRLPGRLRIHDESHKGAIVTGTTEPENTSGRTSDIVAVASPYEGKKLSLFDQIAISAYWFATNFLWGAMLVIMLPGEVARMAPAFKGPALGILLGLGAVIALIVPLIVGVLSDRCTSRFGRRRPYIAWGVAINVLGLVLMCAAITTAPTTLGGRVLVANPTTSSISVKAHERRDLGIEKGEAIRFLVTPRTRLIEDGAELPKD